MKVRIFQATAVVVALLSFSIQSHARDLDKGFYVSGSYGQALNKQFKRLEQQGEQTAKTDSNRSLRHFGIALGKHWTNLNNLRTELEVTHAEKKLTVLYSDEHVYSEDFAFGNYTYRYLYKRPDVKADAALRSTNILLNSYYDIPVHSRFTPYVGAGAGVMLAHSKIVRSVAGNDTLTQTQKFNKEYFAFQLSTGANIRITDKLSVGGGYRYLNNLGKAKAFQGGQHVITSGITYHF